LSPQKGGAWKETILYEFSGGSDGDEPNGGLAIDGAGNLYGVTRFGGANNSGTAFELSQGPSGWTETLLYSFCSLPSCADGGDPLFAPLLDPSGNLYGTDGGYPGVAYELSPGLSSWTENVLYTFCSQPNCADGTDPEALVRDSAGNLYGPTESGGSDGYANGAGVVFSLRREPDGGWSYLKLHDFAGNRLGAGSLAITLHGSGLFGDTAGCGTSYCGTLFDLTVIDRKMQANRLYAFANNAEGLSPAGSLAFDSAGNMYGGTSLGGAICGCGVVFEMTPESGGTWQYQIIHDFDDQDGAAPQYGVVYHGGHLFGTTLGGRRFIKKIIFDITP